MMIYLIKAFTWALALIFICILSQLFILTIFAVRAGDFMNPSPEVHPQKPLGEHGKRQEEQRMIFAGLSMR